MGFRNGEQVFTDLTHTLKKNKIWPDIVQRSDKVVHLLDMCGHEKYLKTTMFGINSLYPDYCMVVVGANMGLSKMSKEHIGIAWALELPIIVVFTKTDLAPEQVYKENLKKVGLLVKEHCAKVPVLVKTQKDAQRIKDKMATGKICPIFSVSNFTGDGIELLRNFLGALNKPIKRESQENNAQNITTKFTIDSSYHSKGLGLILCGTVVKGSVQVGQKMMFGPDANGNFKEVQIKGIHENRVTIDHAFEQSSVTLKIKVTNAKDTIKE